MASNIGVWTPILTNGTITITANMGIRSLSIYNSSSVAGSYQGSLSIGGLASVESPISQYQTVSLEGNSNAGYINDYVITAPSGCTLQIIGQQF